MKRDQIRNFCIIAHIDHGKSTLADRLLEITGTISAREMQDQVLDSMELEREKGVTIKASAVRMRYEAADGKVYQLNLIDTPGHVDFSYEVSRALEACEGAVLIVDATQGVEAQTLANLYLALEADLEIVPVVNKIDLPSARPDEVAQEVAELLGVDLDDVARVSAKEGTNARAILEAVIRQVPPPAGDPTAPLRALIFDSHYDSYKGVVAYIRVVDGDVGIDDQLGLMASAAAVDPLEVGTFSPGMKPVDGLSAGEVGYIATGLKTVREFRVGDTLIDRRDRAAEPLPGYRSAKPMVFASIYPTEGEDFNALRDALEKLQLNDAALGYTPESSEALNFGFRCGFLGLFHMDIIQERLEREYGLDIIATAPSVQYQIALHNGETITISSPADLPDESLVEEIREPWMHIHVFTPETYYGPVMELVTNRRGIFTSQEYPSVGRVILHFDIPLAEILIDFYDKLKSVSRGYASLDYEFAEYRPDKLVKVDVLVNQQVIDSLAIIVHEKDAYHRGQALVSRLKELIPRQQFQVPIQAAVGKRILSRANVKALRKDVLAKCYGGDVTRKRKLLEKQKAGKKRLKRVGNVDIPQEAFMAVLQLSDD
jgi:GTP-binding protein LepA